MFFEEAEFFELIALCRLNMLAEANSLKQELIVKLESGRILETNTQAARWALANVHAANGDIATAIAMLQGLVNAPSIHQEVRADLAACFRQAGRDEEAIGLWRELQREMGQSRQSIAMDELGLIDGIGPNEDVLFERNIEMAVAIAERESALSSRLRAKVRLLTDIAVSAELAELREGVEQHVELVGQLAARLAAAVGCDSRQQWFAEVAGRLHDVGKCAIPERLRLKPGEPSFEELQLLRERATLGARLVEASNEPELMPVAEAIRSLHEHYDGSGYPARLSGPEIPLLARVVAICETFVVMTEPRADRQALPSETALTDIKRKGGTQFDPVLVSAFAAIAGGTPTFTSTSRKSSH
jgi:HD-GYP domain-containing protein (c-di-GMP phosphodiesterase class II)